MEWKYEIDPAYSPKGRVPPSAIIAAAPLDEEGEVAGPWKQNPSYTPSALALQLDRSPHDHFLLAFGSFLRGEISPLAFREKFQQSVFHVLRNEAQDALLLVASQGGTAYSLFTSIDFFDGNPDANTVALSGAEIVLLANNCVGLLVNQSTEGALWLPISEVSDQGGINDKHVSAWIS